MKTSLLCAAGIATISLASGSASALIMSVSGQTTQITPPVSCVPGASVNANVQVWNEAQNRSLFQFPVDMVNNPGNSSGPIPGTISGLADSHFIHYDDLQSGVTASGTVTFNNPIVGVNLFAASLDATDGPFGALGTTYPTFFPARDLTFNTSTFSINGNVITFNLDNLTAGMLSVMQIRVFTQVPSPGGAALAGLAATAALRRRRRAQ